MRNGFSIGCMYVRPCALMTATSLPSRGVEDAPAVAGHALVAVVEWSQDARLPVELGDDLALVPDVVAAGDHVDARIEQRPWRSTWSTPCRRPRSRRWPSRSRCRDHRAGRAARVSSATRPGLPMRSPIIRARRTPAPARCGVSGNRSAARTGAGARRARPSEAGGEWSIGTAVRRATSAVLQRAKPVLTAFRS